MLSALECECGSVFAGLGAGDEFWVFSSLWHRSPFIIIQLRAQLLRVGGVFKPEAS